MNDNTIYPCLWFNGNAKEAMQLYCSIFPDSQVVADTPMVVNATLSGQLFMGLNGGAQFTANASISFMVMCTSAAEANEYWEKLLLGGTALMPMNKYEWSERYGWVLDRFGISWQIYTGDAVPNAQKIVPTLMFAEAQQGKAEAAVHFYTGVFKPSTITGILKYPGGPTEGQVQHAQFTIKDFIVMAMDSGVPQTFSFTEGISIVIQCDNQQQIDYYWDAFTKEGKESMCGWCKDRYGVSWQIIPRSLSKLMSDPQRGQRVMNEILKMKKLDLARLEKA